MREHPLGNRMIEVISAVLFSLLLAAVIPAASFALSENGAPDDAAQPQSVDLNGMTEENAETDELLVLVGEGTTKREIAGIVDDAGASLDGVNTLSDGTRLAKVTLGEPEDAQEAADKLAFDDKVMIVQPNYRYSLAEQTEEGSEKGSEEGPVISLSEGDGQQSVKEQLVEVIDGKMLTQWYMGRTLYQGRYYGKLYTGCANVFDSWSGLSDSGEEVIVAVVDSGVWMDHPDLEGTIIADKCTTFSDGRQYGFDELDGKDDDNGHGTHVCGIIAARTDDTLGISGVAKDRAKLIVIDAASVDDNQAFQTLDVICAIDYAVENGASVINLSLGGIGHDELLAEAVNRAYSAGALCVCAAGNERTDLEEMPGDTEGAISVMAHGTGGGRTLFSNYGPEKDVSAPGTDIVSTFIDEQKQGQGKYVTTSGTSMSSPIVAGLAALLKSEDADLNPREIKNLIYTSSGDRDFGELGFGRINAVNAVDNVHGSSEPDSIVLNRTDVSARPGDSFVLEYAVYPGTASRSADEVAFSSSRPEAVAVDSDGRVTAKALGSAVITASCRGAEAACAVTVALPISDATISGVKDKTYTGRPLTQSIAVKYDDVTLKEGTDYSVSYRNNVNAGTATVKVTGKGQLTGSKELTFRIHPQKAAPAVTLSAATYRYDGKAKTPAVTVRVGNVTLKKGTDYTVNYSAGRTNAGSYSAAVKLKGNYAGSSTKTFRIVKAANTLAVSPKAAAVSKKTVKRKAKTISRARVLSVSRAKGRVAYVKLSGSKRLSIDQNTGDVTVRKNTKKGTHRMLVGVSAAGSANYAAATKKVTVSVRVK